MFKFKKYMYDNSVNTLMIQKGIIQCNQKPLALLEWKPFYFNMFSQIHVQAKFSFTLSKMKP